MKLKELLKSLESIAPLQLAEEWDNVGLLAGDPEQDIKNVMLTIDMTPEVFQEAKSKKIDLIIAYHPPVFEPIKKVVADQGTSPLLYDAIRSGIAIYSFHTALDVVQGGINDLLADIVGIESASPLTSQPLQTAKRCKLITFVPEPDLAKVSEAIFDAGAGNLGPKDKYSKCSFRIRGTGTFQCGPDSHPTIGTPGHFEQVEEFRLETILPTANLPDVIKAMTTAHSYEEVAYDIIPLYDTPTGMGLGRFGPLAHPTTVPLMIETIKKALNLKTVGIIGPKRGKIKSAAVCAGSCGTILRDVIRNNCDFYLTGELKHHHALELQNAGVTTLCTSHTNSERIILPQIARKLRTAHKTLKITTSKKDRDPFTWQ